jgi:hypothetical protein
MDNACSLWRFSSVSDSPLPDFIRTSGEEASQIQLLSHGGNNLW